MSAPRIHPNALVETTMIGESTNIWAYAHVMADVEIGSKCNIGDHCFIESGVIIGDNVTIKNGNMLFDGIVLEDGVFVGPHVFFTNDLYPRSPRLPQAAVRYTNKDWFAPTLVKYGASLGAGAVILAGTTIGEFAMVGAGAVITKDVSPYALVIGSPGKRIGWVCQCGIKLEFGSDNIAVCSKCGAEYKQESENSIWCEKPAVS